MKFSFNELGKKEKSVLLVYGIVAFICILAFIIIPFPKSASSWLALLFLLVSFCVSLYAMKLAFENGKEIISKIYGFPIFKISVYYVAAQAIFSVLVCVIASFINLPYWVTLLVSVILLGAAVIGIVVTDNARDIIEDTEEKDIRDTKKITLFKIDIAGIVDRCNDENAKKELEKLSEAFRYSDPVSSDATKELEDEITEELGELKKEVAENDAEDIIEKATEISNLLAERNRICKAFKK